MAENDKKRDFSPWWAKEGASGAQGASDRGRDGARPSRVSRVASLAVLAALAIGAGAWWWMARGTEDEEAERRGGTRDARHETRSTVAKDGVVKSDGLEADNAGEVAAKPSVETNLAAKGVAPEGSKKISGPVYTNKVKGLRPIEAIGLDGKPIARRKPIFRKPLERALGIGLMPFRGPGASSVSAMMRRFSDEQIIEMLKEPVQISKDDTESAIEAKLNVQELKERVLRHVEGGGSVRDVFREIDESLSGAAHERHITRIGLEEAKRTGDPEVVRAWVAARNAKLREAGLPEIKVPKQFRNDAGEDGAKGPVAVKESEEQKRGVKK